MKKFSVEFEYKFSDSPLVFNCFKQILAKNEKYAKESVKAELKKDNFIFVKIVSCVKYE